MIILFSQRTIINYWHFEISEPPSLAIYTIGGFK